QPPVQHDHVQIGAAAALRVTEPYPDDDEDYRQADVNRQHPDEDREHPAVVIRLGLRMLEHVSPAQQHHEGHRALERLHHERLVDVVPLERVADPLEETLSEGGSPLRLHGRTEITAFGRVEATPRPGGGFPAPWWG